jgi:putative transposase
MPNTYTQIYLQFVFAVSKRQCLIPREHKEELHRLIGGLVRARNCKPLAIHCMPDHAHIFVGYRPTKSISDLVRDIKVESNFFINGKRWTPYRFAWQESYAAFSYARSDIGRSSTTSTTRNNIIQKKTFRSEFVEMLTDAGIEYDDKYLFEFFDDLAQDGDHLIS